MEKRKYEKPMLVSEAFIPNEYVAVCFLVKCDVCGSDESPTYNNLGGGRKEENNTHSCDTGCGDPNNQYITGDIGSWTFMEINSDQGSALVTENITYGTVGDNAAISWNTRNTRDGRIWHHHGHMIGSRPNHS